MRRVVIVQPYVTRFRVPFFLQLHRELATSGIALTVLHGHPSQTQARRADASELDFGVNVRQLSVHAFNRAAAWKNVRGHIGDADLTIFEFASAASLEAYRPLANAKRERAIGLWGHGGSFVSGGNVLDTSLELWQARRADRLFVYTDSGRTHLTSRAIPAEKITVVKNATDTADLRRLRSLLTDSDVAAFRQRWGIGDGPIALAIGSLDEPKRVPLLLETAAMVSTKLRGFQLVVAGDGEDADLVRQAAMSPDVVYIGRVDNQQLAALSRIGAAILNPGRVGLVAVDSFAMETPVVTTSWSHHAPEFDYLEHDINAVIVPDNIESLTQAILELLVDPVGRLDVLRDGCRRSADEYSTERMVANFAKGIELTLEQPRRGRVSPTPGG